MITTMNNIIGGGDMWSPNLDGSTNIQTLTSGDTYVEFDNVPANDDFGYVVWIFPDTATDPTVDPPKQLGELVFTTPVDGLMTVKCHFAAAVTSAQAGTICKLRIVR